MAFLLGHFGRQLTPIKINRILHPIPWQEGLFHFVFIEFGFLIIYGKHWFPSFQVRVEIGEFIIELVEAVIFILLALFLKFVKSFATKPH